MKDATNGDWVRNQWLRYIFLAQSSILMNCPAPLHPCALALISPPEYQPSCLRVEQIILLVLFVASLIRCENLFSLSLPLLRC